MHRIRRFSTPRHQVPAVLSPQPNHPRIHTFTLSQRSRPPGLAAAESALIFYNQLSAFFSREEAAELRTFGQGCYEMFGGVLRNLATGDAKSCHGGCEFPKNTAPLRHFAFRAIKYPSNLVTERLLAADPYGRIASELRGGFRLVLRAF
jgi:hypothetical protein